MDTLFGYLSVCPFSENSSIGTIIFEFSRSDTPREMLEFDEDLITPFLESG